jgi:hypothetical protein
VLYLGHFFSPAAALRPPPDIPIRHFWWLPTLRQRTQQQSHRHKSSAALT